MVHIRSSPETVHRRVHSCVNSPIDQVSKSSHLESIYLDLPGELSADLSNCNCFYKFLVFTWILLCPHAVNASTCLKLLPHHCIVSNFNFFVPANRRLKPSSSHTLNYAPVPINLLFAAENANLQTPHRLPSARRSAAASSIISVAKSIRALRIAGMCSAYLNQSRKVVKSWTAHFDSARSNGRLSRPHRMSATTKLMKKQIKTAKWSSCLACFIWKHPPS